jgi:hypothetical protein
MTQTAAEPATNVQPARRMLRDVLALPSRAIRAGWSESAVWTPEAA